MRSMVSVDTVKVRDLMVLSAFESGLERPFREKFARIREGWTLEADVSQSFGLMDFMSVIRDGEGFIIGRELLTRSEALGDCLGQRDAVKLVRDQDLIPRELRGRRLVFPGTQWKHANFGLCIPALNFKGQWRFDFALVNVDWTWLDLVALDASAPTHELSLIPHAFAA